LVGDCQKMLLPAVNWWLSWRASSC